MLNSGFFRLQDQEDLSLLLARVKLVATLSFDLSCVFFRVVQGLLHWNLVVVVAGQYQQPFKASSQSSSWKGDL